MVRAILASTKSQTRRAFSPRMEKLMRAAAAMGEVSHFLDEGSMQPNDLDYVRSFCPYGQPGDRLWVRETWCRQWDDERGFLDECWYRASDPDVVSVDAMEKSPWKPSIHMPRWASRITLDIKAVRIERLQDISDQDAAAEGVATWAPGALSPDSLNADPSDQFRWLWCSINGPDSWDANPWVWVVEFERAKATEKGKRQ
ncbi:predicted protein [Nematostella vectensis]|uniref:Morphogenetic protein n=2 Tax=cellular organisms TaxID=131567 RepID=A8DW69_NEMVE|nr:predicted protein [Nematostella vectensis]|eukprot:XP_001617640.1 hypothetical protein NEMVEDRAFT_v1g225921 [Nematostella vectensis]